MKAKIAIICVLAFSSLGMTEEHWGFFGHKKINELAVYTLPEEMFGFYKAHLEFLIDHSVDPDKRRYGVKGEAERHYIDLDRYCGDSLPCNPFENIPRRWTDAVAKFTEDTLRAHGIVPWHVNLMTIQLTEAFRAENLDRILRLSAELGHYVGDAHVPLHTTSNYNGQKTNQRGIHGFWESRLPELFLTDYDFFVGKAEYIDSPLNFIWDRVAESFAAVDTVLGFEADLNESYPSDQKYAYEDRGQTNMKVYSREYSAAYSQMLDDQVERRMKSAVVTLGCLWYTCWVDAGQPDLTKFSKAKISPEAIEEIVKEEITSDPNLKVREHDN
ncbi:MAG: zinc dependent phospholipase C family protein [Flavobacteriales bacterium]|nr:zinc dependent phospholipase C family protein [Flavobacteriales bacterium]